MMNISAMDLWIFSTIVFLSSNTIVGSLTLDSECGSSIGCFYELNGDNCDFIVTWRPDGDDGVYTLSSNVLASTPYMALGFSSDEDMGDDDVLGCAMSSTGDILAFSSTNIGKSSPIYTDDEVRLTNGSSVNQIMTCTIRRPKSPKLDRVDIEQPWIYMFASGESLFSGENFTSIRRHGCRLASSRNFTIDTIDTSIPSVPPPDDDSLTLNAECGSSIGCFSECSGDNCEFIVTWRPDGDDGVYTLSSSLSGTTPYMALGFSSDADMGDDDVLGCAMSVTGDFVAFSSTNIGKRSTIYTDEEVVLVSGSRNNQILACTIRRPKIGKDLRVDVEKAWILMFAKGETWLNGDVVETIGYHTDRFVSSQELSINDAMTAVSQSTERTLVKYHGSLMTIAWLLFASVGILIPRYFKNAWEDDICNLKIWFQMHRLCMVLVLLLTVLGFVVIFVEVGDWSELVGEDSHLKAHPVMGTVVMGLTLLNPIMALFRPAPTSSKRKLFNGLHLLVGQGGYILAMTTVYFGVLLEVADTPDAVFYILIGYSAWSLLIELGLVLSSYWYKCPDKSEQYELSEGINSKMTSSETSKGLKLKKSLLGFHVFVAAGFAATITAMIAIGKDNF